MKETRDEVLEQQVQDLHRKVEIWATANDLWFDCKFFDYIEFVKPVECDRAGYVTVLAGPLYEMAMSSGEDPDLVEEFEQILKKSGFWYERWSQQLRIYPYGHAMENEFREYMRWKWICSLIKPDFDFMDQDLYNHFGINPDRLSGLGWREFETIVAALLEAQGYQVDLGPGMNDGGIDLKLIQRDPIGDIMTLVQVKRYKKDLKIRLEAVQALHGASAAEGAAKSIFVTTSAYLPSAKRFAERDSVPMTLHTSSDVQQWCVDAYNGIVEDKRKLISQEHVTRTLEKARIDDQKILRSNAGYTMAMNQFSLVLKETRNAALLLELPRKIIEHDGYEQRGIEVPDTQAAPPLSRMGRTNIRRVRILNDDGGREFWDGEKLHLPWDGKPVNFDYCD